MTVRNIRDLMIRSAFPGQNCSFRKVANGKLMLGITKGNLFSIRANDDLIIKTLRCDYIVAAILKRIFMEMIVGYVINILAIQAEGGELTFLEDSQAYSIGYIPYFLPGFCLAGGNNTPV